MKAMLRISGPGVNREVALDPGGAEVTLGRDAKADVPLMDPQRYLSRKHVAVWQSGEGVEVRVVSAMNGIETSRGPADPGQIASLGSGDHFTLGPYHVDVVMLPGDAPPSRLTAASGGVDPFDALLGRKPTAPQGGDPFAGPDFRARQAAPAPPAVDPFDALIGGNGAASPAESAGPFGNLLGGTERREPDAGKSIGARGAEVRSDPLPGSRLLDDWLGGPGARQGLRPVAPDGAGPLDAFLGRAGAPAKKALSPDHVHSINMPLQFGTPSARGGAAPTQFAPPSAAAAAPSPGGASSPADAADQIGDDPFDDWADTGSPLDIDAAPPPDAGPSAVVPSVSAPKRSAGGQTGAWPAFARGLGLPPTQAFNEQAAEQAGVTVRLVIEGLAELLGARAELKRELRAEDRTMLSGRDNNPLKTKLSAAELIHYLFVAQSGGGYMPADRAIRESIGELRVHEHATIAAARAAVEGALRDFEPGRLKKLLDKGKPGMFQLLDNARLWEAYEQYYEKRSSQMADWLEAVFTRHFMPTYSRESERLKAEGRSDPAA